MRRFDRFATTADVGLRVRGRDLNEFYGNAVAGLSHLLFGPLLIRAADERTRFDYRGDGAENVLVNLLAAALELTWRRHAVTGLEIASASECSLHGTLRHRLWPRPPQLEIKSVTYHNLQLQFRAGIWHAAVVFDI